MMLGSTETDELVAEEIAVEDVRQGSDGCLAVIREC